MKKFFKDFGAFINKGNVLNLAIGLIIGAAFQKIVSSLVNDIIMPIIGVIIGLNVSEASYTLVQASETSEAVILKYGMFIQTIIDFLIIAFTIFLVVHIMTKMQKRLEKVKETAKTSMEELIKNFKKEHDDENNAALVDNLNKEEIDNSNKAFNNDENNDSTNETIINNDKTINDRED